MNPRIRHEIFKKSCQEGQFWQGYVAKFLEGHGFPVTLHLDPIRDQNVALSPNEFEKGDIVVGRSLIIDVKSTGKYRFTNEKDWPFKEIYLDHKHRYDKKFLDGIAPGVYLEVCRLTGGMIWVSVKETRHFWYTKTIMKSNESRMMETYAVSRDHIHPVDMLLESLRDFLVEESSELLT